MDSCSARKVGMFNEASVSINVGPAPTGKPGTRVTVGGIFPAFEESDSAEAKTSALPSVNFE